VIIVGSKQQLSAVDLFCGAGGLSEGFRQAGFHVLAGQDYDAKAGLTFANTHHEAKFLGGPIQEISASDLLRASGLKRGELDVLVGGPPCQGYSVYNHQRGASDPRAGLFREYLRILDGLFPKWLVMENVTGITSIAGGAIVGEIQDGMRKLGYRVEMQILKAEQYGVPQERRRVFFIGTRLDAPIVFPKPTYGGQGRNYVTVWDAISDLPKLKNGEKVDGLPYAKPPQNSYQAVLRGDRRIVENHSSPRLAEINEQRMRHIPPGGSWRDIPFDLLPAGMKLASRSDHTKRYGRPRKSDLACTILTKCDVHWGAYIHPVQDRAFTVREAARLQSFPDSFVFSGSRTEQYIQVGNAVPPFLGKAIAEAVKRSIVEPVSKAPTKKSLGKRGVAVAV
jgi:DNA (cytosine-5)-methyltransferase 1